MARATRGTLMPAAVRLDAAGLLAAHGPKLAFLVALTATAGSLYYSEVRHFTPCELCWYQRILMYPLVALLLVAILSRDAWIPRYVLPLSIVGFGVSTYHYLLQNAIVPDEGFCSGGVSCAAKYVNYFGFVTIPFMAQVAFALITLTMLGTLWAEGREREPEPSQPA